MIDRVIEAQLEDRTAHELAGAWRAMCGMMLVYTAWAVRRRGLCRNEDAQQRNEAKRWVAGKCGVIRFSDCCEAFDLRESKARAAVESLVGAGRRSAISTDGGSTCQ